MTTKQQLKLAAELADYVLSSDGEAADFEEQLRATVKGEGPLEAADGVNGPDWIEGAEHWAVYAGSPSHVRDDAETARLVELFDWLTHNTKGHVYSTAMQLHDSLPPLDPDEEADAFHERLMALANLPYREFAKVVYGKPCPDLLHIEDYMRGKFEKFTEDPLGLILSLDSKNFRRVYEFLHSEEK